MYKRTKMCIVRWNAGLYDFINLALPAELGYIVEAVVLQLNQLHLQVFFLLIRDFL